VIEMSELIKLIKRTNVELDEDICSESDPERLGIFLLFYRAKLKFVKLYISGQKVLRLYKDNKKSTAQIESIVGPLAENGELNVVRGIKKQMEKNIARLKEKIKKGSD
jgi:hypothetical protein